MTTRKNKKRTQPGKKAKTTRRALAKATAGKKSAAKKKAGPKRKPAPKKRAAVKAVGGKKKSSAKKASARSVGARRNRGLRVTHVSEAEARELQDRRTRSAGQSGDLQGLSGTEDADSESVDELLEEGNSFEAGIVAGVEDSGDADEREVRTREVPEDDVPGEYLDND
ncbi:MAG TPA: hypothetical protein VFR08_08730 [Candidatus Angelobacter sp.]|nr:hypothetical protein [Candidatus Angelobacter sp.]